MDRNYIEDKRFDKTDFSEMMLAEGDYEGCTFSNCNFSNANFTNLHFIDCQFSGCNVSTATLTKTTFQNCKFNDCKLSGLLFEDCNSFNFTVEFIGCVLNLSSFYKMKLKKTKFKNSSLQEVDFTETDLSNSLLDNCDLSGATFQNTILEKADLRTSYNYSMDPSQNRIKKAKFSMAGIAGLLDKYDIEIYP